METIKTEIPPRPPKRKKQVKNEIERNSIIGSSEEENKQSLTNLRIALQSNDVHYFPNREPYYPGERRPGYTPIVPVLPPTGGDYSPPTVFPPSGGDYLPPTQINSVYSPSSQPSPPMSSSYQPPTGPLYHSDIPVYQPEIPSITLPFFEPVDFHRPSYTKNTVPPFKETLLHGIPPRRYKKKGRPHKMHHSHTSRPPPPKFHFVEEFSNIPQDIKVKRVPSESSGSLDVKGPGSGIVDLLKSEDLTVMAALLEETELYKSVDKEGESVLVKIPSF